MSENLDRGQVIADWWRGSIANRESGRARALSARLRRANALEALLEPEVHLLASRLALRHSAAGELVRLVQILAEVKETRPESLPRQLGGEDPVLSNLRFQRLLRARGDELTQTLRRAIPMVNRSCNVSQLGTDLLSWDHPDWGDRARVRWTFDYFGKGGVSDTPLDLLNQETAQ